MIGFLKGKYGAVWCISYEVLKLNFNGEGKANRWNWLSLSLNKIDNLGVGNNIRLSGDKKFLPASNGREKASK